jgi:hypothetical protein
LHIRLRAYKSPELQRSARTHGVQEAGSSNPPAPTGHFFRFVPKERIFSLMGAKHVLR